MPDERLVNDTNQINTTIVSILVTRVMRLPATPLKFIRLGRYQSDNQRPIKAIFESKSIVFIIIRNEIKH